MTRCPASAGLLSISEASEAFDRFPRAGFGESDGLRNLGGNVGFHTGQIIR